MSTLFDDDKFNLDDDELWRARMDGPDIDRMQLRELLAAHPEYDGWVTGPLNNAQVREHVAELRGIDGRARHAPESARSNVQPEAVVAPLPAKKSEPPKEKEERKFKVVEAKPTEVTAGTSEWRQFINLKADKNTLQNGRMLEVTAKLDQKQAGIEIFFGLEPDSKNCAEDKLGAGLTAKISASGKTDGEGVAKATLTLSAFGGDMFKVLASLTRNPKPDGDVVKSKPVAVWRKLWYQMAVPEGFSPPDPSKSESAWKQVFVDFEKCDTITVKKSDCPERTFYPEWMVMVGGGDKDAAVVGSHNKKDFFKKFTADASKPLRANLVICEHQWDWEGTTEFKPQFTSKLSQKLSTDDGQLVIKPALKGSVVLNGSWKTKDGKKTGTITDADIEIDRTRISLTEFTLKFPSGAPEPSAENPLLCTFEISYAGSYLGESSGNNILAVYDPNDVDDYNNTITHEVGHSVNQTPRPGQTPGKLGDHPHFYDDVNGGQGPHCSTVAGNAKGTLVTLVKTNGKFSKTRDGRDIEKVYKTGVCVMFHQGDPTCIGKFCETCEPYVRMQDMSKWK